MSRPRFRLRTLMIAVAAAALILSVEATTTEMDPTSKGTLLITCCLIAASSILLSESAPDPGARPGIPRTSMTEDPALALMRLSRSSSSRRSRGAGQGSMRSSRPATVSAGSSWLVTWSLRLWTLAAFLWFVTTALANAYDIRRMEEAAEDIRVLRIVGVVLLCSPASALTLAFAARLALVFHECEPRGRTRRG